MPDQLSTVYRRFLDGGYDCVDRVIQNAYFSLGQSGGGLRVWWRELYGSDENLDENYLMRMAGVSAAAFALGPKRTTSP